MNEKLKETANKLIGHLHNVSENGAKDYFQYDFDCSLFQDWNLTDIRQSEEHKELFDVLGTLAGPVLYWFEILPPTTNEDVRNAISEYKHSIEAKSVPALKSKYSRDSNILYVGKVKRNFWGRVIQHLGYYQVVRTQGLQLYHWARPLNLKLRLHAYQFEPEMEDLVSVFELKFARILKPITGKHS